MPVAGIIGMRAMLVVMLLLCTLLLPVTCGHVDEPGTGNDGAAVSIVRPKNGLFLFDIRVVPLAGQIVIGPVSVEAEASGDIDRVAFVVPPKVGCRPWEVGNDSDPPYGFVWEGSNGAIQDTGLASLIAWGYSDGDRVAEDALLLLRYAGQGSKA
jgi:hypothetical protein